MTDLSLDYWNKLANQIILISSLLSGFSIAVVANLIVHKSKERIQNYILKVSTIAAGCFLIVVFAMTKILMMTTDGFPYQVQASALRTPQIVGGLCFIIGIIALSALIALSGWTTSKSLGIFTTIIGILTLVLTFMMIS